MPTWTSNIPSQVKTYANVSAFPITGSVKTIYIAENTDIAYYWTGSAYQSISIQDLSGLVPYTGATTDVDLGNNDLNAEGIKIKGTGGNGHLGMKHQSSNPTAGGQETVIFAGTDGEPRFKNDGNAVEQFASRQWVNLQGFITNVITALGYTPVPNTRTINGLDLSADRTLTTANINDSTNKRYVTDAQLTVLSNTSGTNTGDETLSRIRTLLGATAWVDYSLTSTIVGWSSFTSRVIDYKYLDANTLCVEFLISGTSNSATTTFTLPSNVVNSLIVGGVAVVNNGGSNANGRMDFTAGSSVVAFTTSITGSTPFSATGTKTIQGSFTVRV